MVFTIGLRTRGLWTWLNYIFNRVDASRVTAVGANRAAAEWVLRLGGSVKFHNFEDWNKDYNRLPSSTKLKLAAIDGSGCAITSNGLEHLDGLMHLEVLILHKCHYLNDDGLIHLEHVKHTLKHLDLSYCVSLTDSGFLSLPRLCNLATLDVRGVDLLSGTLKHLNHILTNCHITHSLS